MDCNSLWKQQNDCSRGCYYFYLNYIDNNINILYNAQNNSSTTCVMVSSEIQTIDELILIPVLSVAVKDYESIER